MNMREDDSVNYYPRELPIQFGSSRDKCEFYAVMVKPQDNKDADGRIISYTMGGPVAYCDSPEQANELAKVLNDNDKHDVTNERWRDMSIAHGAARQMIVEAIETLFGPVASMEGQDAVLLRGPEPHHQAEAIIDALKRVHAAFGGEAIGYIRPETLTALREGDAGPVVGVAGFTTTIPVYLHNAEAT